MGSAGLGGGVIQANPHLTQTFFFRFFEFDIFVIPYRITQQIFAHLTVYLILLKFQYFLQLE